MWKLPDALQLGPLPVPTAGLVLLLGCYVWYALAGRLARRWDLDPALVEDFLYRLLIGGLIGAKLLEVARSPGLVLANPISVLTFPRGSGALLGAVLGGGLWALPILLRHRRNLHRLLDGLAVPLSVGLAVMGVGLPDGRAIPVAIGFAAVALALWFLRDRTRFPGHLTLGFLVHGALVVVSADFFRYVPVVTAGLSTLQLWAAAVAAAAYGAALWFERTTGHPGPADSGDRATPSAGPATEGP